MGSFRHAPPLLLVIHGFAAAQGGVFREATEDVVGAFPNGAACWVDLDDDGHVDLCAPGRIYRNEGGERLKEVARVPGSCVAADFDNDGLPDLFSWSARRLFRNEGGMEFTEVTLPELPDGTSRGASWGDLDGDGFADLFVGGYENWQEGLTYPFFVLHNRGGEGFEVARSERKHRARGVTACDFDEDGDLDVYVSHYRLRPNSLWVNRGDGELEDRASEFGGTATSPDFRGGHSIGAAWGDFDGDGHFDVFAGNFAHVDERGDQPKSRFLQSLGADGGFRFRDRGPCGVRYQESYASPSAADFDNDGDLDLFFTTVYGTASFGRRNHAVLFRNDGDFSFVDVNEEAGLPVLGPTYQAAWADFDNDGDLDLVSGGKLFLNDAAGSAWLQLVLEGDGVTVDRSAIGAQARIRIGDAVLTRQVEAGTGEGNQNDLRLHFGLGDHEGPVDVEIRWPGGRRQVVEDLATSARHRVRFERRDDR